MEYKKGASIEAPFWLVWLVVNYSSTMLSMLLW